MKNFLVILICYSSIVIGKSQDSLFVAEHYIGIDASFINALIPLNNDIGFTAPYRFNHRRYKSDKTYNRHGLNFDLSGVFSDGGVDPNNNSNNLMIDYRFGKGRDLYSSKRFQVSGGWDMRYRIDYNNTKVASTTNNPDSGSKNNSFEFRIGTGPFVGLEIKINERLSIYTDTHVYLNLSYEWNRFVLDQSPDDASPEHTVQYWDWQHLPTHIIFFYKY